MKRPASENTIEERKKLTVRTQAEVAKIMGVSIFVVQEDEYSAIAKLQEALRPLWEDMQRV